MTRLESNLDAFIEALTELSRVHNIAITGTPIVFVMEPIDHLLVYQVDDDSNLVLG